MRQASVQPDPPSFCGASSQRSTPKLRNFAPHTCRPPKPPGRADFGGLHVWTPKLRNFAPSTCGPQRAKTPTWSRSPGIHGAHSRGSRSGGRTDSPRVCGGSCGHGSCAEQDGRRNRPRAPQTSRAPQVWSERGGRAKRLCSVPRTGQSYLTLVLARVGTNGRRHGTLGSTRAGGKVT